MSFPAGFTGRFPPGCDFQANGEARVGDCPSGKSAGTAPGKDRRALIGARYERRDKVSRREGREGGEGGTVMRERERKRKGIRH